MDVFQEMKAQQAVTWCFTDVIEWANSEIPAVAYRFNSEVKWLESKSSGFGVTVNLGDRTLWITVLSLPVLSAV